MSRIFLISILFASFFSSLQAVEQPKTIVFSFGSHNGAPYTLTNGNNIIGGIIWDIAHELVDELDVQASFVNIPRKRQARYLEKGETDVILISNSMWLSNKDNLVWSKALFKESNMLVTLAENPLILNSKHSLYGLNIGTIRGYKYPLIDEDINQHHITRDDVRELDANLEKLLLARVDAFIDSSILINYRLSKREDAGRFRVAPLIISTHQIYAAISPKSSVAPQKIVTALEKLKNNGVIEAILHKYE